LKRRQNVNATHERFALSGEGLTLVTAHMETSKLKTPIETRENSVVPAQSKVGSCIKVQKRVSHRRKERKFIVY
jgi:hypothetical protein